jgi:hypothetical protein
MYHEAGKNMQLYNWVVLRQRQLYKKKGGLSEIRIKKLEELGFPWEVARNLPEKLF